MQLSLIHNLLSSVEEQKSNLLKKLDFEGSKSLLESSDGRNLLLDLLDTTDPSISSVASYVLSEDGPGTIEYLHQIAELVRASENDLLSTFCAIIFQFPHFWDKRYADILLRCLNHSSLMVRERTIIIMAGHNNAAYEDSWSYLQEFTKIDELRKGIAHAFEVSKEVDLTINRNNIETFENDEDWMYFMNHMEINRAIRGLYIVSIIRNGAISNLRSLNIPEDESIIKGLRRFLD